MYRTLLRTMNFHQASYNRSRSLSTHHRNNNQKIEPSYDFNRKWWPTVSPEDRGANSFKLISYNILAQDLLMEHLYLYVNIKQEWLTWRRRLENLKRELVKLDPDILCLQEMQYDHLPLLVNYLCTGNGKRLEYVYKKKTGHRTDGCAIIYDASKFQLMEQQAVELYDEQVKLLNRENVALFAKFRFKEEKQETKEVIVATTHLLYNPKRDDVRCAQAMRLIEELAKFAEFTPIVLTGDFNSLRESPPLDLLTKQQDSLLKFEALDPGEDTASTYQDEWVTVDYMLRSLPRHQSCSRLQVESIYRLPSIQSCQRVGQIPNHYLGSDHYSMGAIFRLV